jgi:hypothetical protein
MRRLRKIILTLVIVVGAYWVFQKLEIIPSLKDIFAPKPVVLDETPILIKEIKSIGQLVTYSASDEVVADSTIVSKVSAFINSFNRIIPFAAIPPIDKRLVLIGRGKVLAGTNLALLHDSSLHIINDTVTLIMPRAQILDAILNPGDFETFVERGEWSSQEVAMVKIQARRKIIERALRQNILQNADDKARLVMENFLRNMGYKRVLVFSQ